MNVANDDIKRKENIMELYISVAALVVSILSIIVSVMIYFLGLRREKKQATLDAFNLLQTQVLDRLNCYRRYDIDEIAEDVHSTDYQDISGLLARCTHFAVGVNTGIYDFDTVRKMAGRYMIALYEKLEPLVEKKRKINSSERHYQELEILIDKLRKFYK